MIKLFWNTHNHQHNTTEDQNIKKQDDVDYKWGLYHKKSSDVWVYEILKKIEYKPINSDKDLKKDDILIIVDSNPEKKIELYNKLRMISSKIFLIHLGDEFGSNNLSTVYNICDYIFRSFCSNKYFNNSKVKCIAMGYKSGIKHKEKKTRKYKWAFTGTPHKSGRHDLLFQFSDIKPHFCHKTEKFDTRIISVEEMSDVLSSTQFVPCPMGFFHPESYRLYEALQCGCIPIVENAYQYYDRLFPGHPFIKIDKWADAKPIIQSWGDDEIIKKQKECSAWWNNYKKDIQEIIKGKIK